MPGLGYEQSIVNLGPPTTASLLLPLLALGGVFGTGQAAATAKHGRFVRAIVPQTGTIKDISVVNGTTLKGEVLLAVYDTGEAAAGEYTLLAESTLKAQSGKLSWQSVGTLGGLALTAGQHIMVGIMSTETGEFRTTYETSKEAVVPAGYLTGGGGNEVKLSAEHTFAESKFASPLKESEMTLVTPGFMFIGRVS